VKVRRYAHRRDAGSVSAHAVRLRGGKEARSEANGKDQALPSTARSCRALASVCWPEF